MEGANRHCLTIGDCKEGDIIVVDGEEWTLQWFTQDGWGALYSSEEGRYAVIKGDTPCEKA